MKRALLALWAVFVVASPVAAYQMHANANAPRVAATWQQPVVTVDSELMAHLAVEWGAPFDVTYAATGADITVDRVAGLAKAERIHGDAEPTIDGDRVVACHIRLDDDATVTVWLHELGHCLGLVGHTEPGTLMSTFGDTPVVTDADRRNLDRLYQ